MTRYLIAATLAVILAAAAARLQHTPTPQVTIPWCRLHPTARACRASTPRPRSNRASPAASSPSAATTSSPTFGASFIVAVQNKRTGARPEFGPGNIPPPINGERFAVLAADELDAKVKDDSRGYLRATPATGTVDIEAATAQVTREYRFNNFGGCPAGESDA